MSKQFKAIFLEGDEEFLECINDYTEAEKNCIIGYIKNREDCLKAKFKEAIEKHTRTGAPFIDKKGFMKELGLDGKQK